jgi:PAS domain S-box-containing protein
MGVSQAGLYQFTLIADRGREQSMTRKRFDKILVIDDSSANLQLLMNHLTGQGYTVYPASDGELALEFVQSTLPDLIMLDIRMPGMDGYEVCRRLQADKRTRPIPIVFLSALEDEQDKVKGFQAGGVDYITKPFQPEELLARVAIHLRMRALTEGLEEEVVARTKELSITNKKLLREITQRKEIEEALQKERELFISGPNVAYIVRAEPGWPLEYLSPNMKDQFGYDPRTLIQEQKLVADIIHPDDLELVTKAIESNSNAGKSYFSLEFRVLSASSDTRWVYNFIVVRRDANGLITHYQGYLNDITERKLASERLRDSQQRLDNILANSPSALYRCANDEHWTMEFISAGIKRITGYAAEDFHNNRIRSFASIIYPDDCQDVADAVASSLANKENYEMDYRLVAADGALRWVHQQGRGVFTAEGELSCLDGTIFDITTQREAEESVKLNAERMEALLQLNQMAGASEIDLMRFAYEAAIRLTRSKLGYLGLMDEAETVLKVQFWSPEAMALCNVSGKPLNFPLQSAGLWGEAVRQRRPVITNDYSAPNPWKKGTPEGHVKLIRHMNLPLIVDGKIVVVAGVGNKEENYNQTDVKQLSLMIEGMWGLIERRRAEEELNHYHNQLEDTVMQRTEELRLSRDAAEAANKAKSVFLANMSHELRTPLNAILGFSSIVRTDPLLPEKQRQNLEIINRSGEHLLALINDVLEMAKIEAGGMLLTTNPFDLGDMIRDVTDMMQMRANEKGLQLIIDQSSKFPRYIVGDEPRLRQILINLVGNAIKYTEQGSVTIRLGTEENELSHLLIEVEDSGPGIAPQDQPRIFEPFVQLSNNGASKGTGLGLTITYKYVQMMGGNIYLESTLGKGSLFRINLPLIEATESDIFKTEQQVAGNVIGLAPGQKRKRILIVEDQIDNQALLSHLMESVGLRIKVAENGKKGVELFQSWKPHLILMDRLMPVMNGEDATKRIRQLPQGQAVKIVAVTASAFKEQRKQMLEAGMDDVVGKPYRPGEIYACLSKQLGISFQYEEKDESAEQSGALTAEMLSVLPIALRNELCDALESLERNRIDRAIQQVGEHDQGLQKRLDRLVESFNYPAILQVLEKELTKW